MTLDEDLRDHQLRQDLKQALRRIEQGKDWKTTIPAPTQQIQRYVEEARHLHQKYHKQHDVPTWYEATHTYLQLYRR